MASLYKVENGERIKIDIEWAEICFVPSEIAYSKNGPEYRYIAKRQALAEQKSLPGMKSDKQRTFPFPTMELIDKK